MPARIVPSTPCACPRAATGGRPYNNGRRHSVALAYPTLLFAEGDIKNPMPAVVYDICVCNSPDHPFGVIYKIFHGLKCQIHFHRSGISEVIGPPPKIAPKKQKAA